MNLQDGDAAIDVRIADRNLTVETTGTQQRGVQNVLAVGSCHHNNALVGGEPIHLNQQLV